MSQPDLLRESIDRFRAAWPDSYGPAVAREIIQLIPDHLDNCDICMFGGCEADSASWPIASGKWYLGGDDE